MRHLLFPALLLPLAACSIEHGKVPVIDALTLPATVTLDADGTYHVTGTISYHDDDDEVARIRVSIPSLNAAAQLSAPGGQKAESAAFTFKVAGDAPKGKLTIEVLILDQEGNASNPKQGSVTLQ